MANKKKLNSCIIGQAQVIFGGGVGVEFGRIGSNDGAIAIGLSELKHPAGKAGEEPPSDETFGVQVSLVFPDLFTLRHFREMLDEVEVALKSDIKDAEAQQELDFDDADPNHLVHQHDNDIKE